MWPHFVSLLYRAWAAFLQSMGTTGLGFFTPVVVFAATIILTLAIIAIRQGKNAMKEHWKKNAALTTVVTLAIMVVVYGLLFARNLVKVIYDDHNSLVARIKVLSSASTPCPVCDSSKNPPIQVIIPPPPTKDSPFPCDYAMKFTQTESSDSLGPNPFEERVEFIPKKFEVKGDSHITPIVLFYTNATIVSGSAQGVMKDQYTGDPLAAGINLSVGRAGIVIRHPEVAELWIGDQEKFSKAKKVVVDFFGPERFKVICVKQLVVTNRYITVPNATPPK